METSTDFVTSGVGKDKLSFRNIVLQHLKKILDLSLIPRQRALKTTLYNESVLNLCDVLMPFFDKEMNDKYKEFEDARQEVYKKSSEKQTELNKWQYAKYHHEVFTPKIKVVFRRLFRQLNLLMNRQDYLKQSVYSEADED